MFKIIEVTFFQWFKKVSPLQTAINRTDCGDGQLCAAQPSDCDPSTSSSCFFLAAKQISGRNFDFGLSGESDGYIAATLSLDSELVCQVLSLTFRFTYHKVTHSY